MAPLPLFLYTQGTLYKSVLGAFLIVPTIRLSCNVLLRTNSADTLTKLNCLKAEPVIDVVFVPLVISIVSILFKLLFIE